MPANANTVSPPTAPPLRFRCGLCDGVLEIPAALAGISGPCPFCRGHITAPVPVMAIPPPPAPIKPPAPVVPPPAIAPLPPPVAPPRQPVQSPAAALEPDPLPPAPRISFPEPPPQRGVFGDHPEALDETAGIPVERRSGGWLDGLLVTALIAVVLLCIAVVLWTEPVMPAREAAIIPENLPALIVREKATEESTRQDALLLSRIQTEKFLAATTAAEASVFLINPPADLPWPLFPGLTADQLSDAYTRRISGTSRYLAGFTGPGGLPELPVEMTESGPRLYTPVLLQQRNDLFTAFRNTLGQQGEAQLFVLCAPPPAEMESAYRADRPDLATYRMVELVDPFSAASPRPAAIGCFAPDSAAAGIFAARAHDPGHRRARVELKWQRHREAGPWIEITRFLPDIWSGDRPETEPVATAPR